MKKFIIKTIFISLPILLSGLFMEVLLRNIPNDYEFKKEYLDKNASEIETLILGSSHSFYGFNPVYFTTKTFNASHISQSLNYDFEIIKKYQFGFKQLKTIVLPISYFTLFGKLEAGSESWRVKNYILYYGLKISNSYTDYSEVLSNKINVNLKRLGSYYIKGNSAISCTSLGWGTNYKSENARDLIETGKTAALRHSKDINDIKYKIILRDNELTLSSIVAWCKNRNISLVLLTPPAFKTYRQNLNEAQLNETIEIAKRIDLDNSNCIYLNLLNDTNFVSKDFYDADHLSEIGAEKLSKLINEKINNWK
ncbi:MAG: hypothetical protein HQ522_05140 [Bacteroidetes bacterium]|nr:hypothetical protein [Bacteroidota bacterium]